MSNAMTAITKILFIICLITYQALAASCFDESEHNNVDNVVVPVLCNLAACSINLQVSKQ